MIQDIDETMRQLLVAELGRTPGCPVYDPDQVSFDPPDVADAAQDGEARVNLYLYDVRENLDRREEGLFRRPGQAKDQTVGIHRGPIHLDLSYLVTAHAGDDPALEHRLLSDVLTVLLRFGAIPEQYWTGELKGAPEGIPLAIVQPNHLELLNSGGMWQAFPTTMRPGLSVVATAAFDPFETKWTRQVREVAFGAVPSDTSDGTARPERLANIRVSVGGIVLDQQTEQPLAGAAACVDGYDEVHSGADGMFSLLNLPSGPCTVRIEARGYRPTEVPAVVPPPGRSDQWDPLVVALRPLDRTEREAAYAERATEGRRDPFAVASGRVPQVSLAGTLTMPDGGPAAYVSVRAGQSTTTTNADGIYCFFDLPSGDHKVTAVIPGQGEIVVLTHHVP